MALVLASGSPRREMLLRQIGLEFEVVPSGEDEAVPAGVSPREVAEMLATAKAKAVASGRNQGIVIGADTVVVLDGVILGKPSSTEEAAQILRTLSGNLHQVITGIVVVDAATGRTGVDSEVTSVKFAPLDEELIARYVATGEPMDKAGAYGIQGYGALLIEGIDGCYFNVVGLPLRCLARLLSTFGYDAFEMRTEGSGLRTE